MIDTIQDIHLQAYDFKFPNDLIATQPAEPRDSARLLILDRKSGRSAHQCFRDLPQYLKPGDCLVINRTKVWPARIIGKKSTGGKADLLLVREVESGVWTALGRGLRPGMRLLFPEDVRAEIGSAGENGEVVCRFSCNDVASFMTRQGLAPLPPYIIKSRNITTDKTPHDRTFPNNRFSSVTPAQAGVHHDDSEKFSDLNHYQTVYAREAGSIAAPTAGLHFTPELLDRLRQAGVKIVEIVLHVGRGTFQPITAEDVREHKMLPEWFHAPAETIAAIQATRANGERVIAVGTTVTRTLETLAQRDALDRQPPVGGLQGWTDLYINPTHEFQVVNALITNFHLPCSSPLILASAFAGKERLLQAYQETIRLRYRLFSYGDAMLIQ